MRTRTDLHDDPHAAGDEILSMGEPYAPVAAWTLDELGQLADLDSLRAAGLGGDERRA
jgi:hypothetical protein